MFCRELRRYLEATWRSCNEMYSWGLIGCLSSQRCSRRHLNLELKRDVKSDWVAEECSFVEESECCERNWEYVLTIESRSYCSSSAVCEPSVDEAAGSEEREWKNESEVDDSGEMDEEDDVGVEGASMEWSLELLRCLLFCNRWHFFSILRLAEILLAAIWLFNLLVCEMHSVNWMRKESGWWSKQERRIEMRIEIKRCLERWRREQGEVYGWRAMSFRMPACISARVALKRFREAMVWMVESLEYL